MYKETKITGVRTVEVKVFGEKVKMKRIYFTNAKPYTLPRNEYNFYLQRLGVDFLGKKVRCLKGLKATLCCPTDHVRRKLWVETYKFDLPDIDSFGQEVSLAFIKEFLNF